MSNNEKAAPVLLDDLAAMDLARRREVAAELRRLAETFAQVADGKTTSRVLGVLAYLVDPA